MLKIKLLAFVLFVSPFLVSAQDLTVFSTSTSGDLGNGNVVEGAGTGYSDRQQTSPDGRYVYFSSDSSNLVVGDTNGLRDAFRKDTQTGEIIRVSVTSGGTESNGISYVQSGTNDGQYVVFGTRATNIDPADTTNDWDVYRFEVATGTVKLLSIYGRNAHIYGFDPNGLYNGSVSISENGRYYLFLSDGQYTPADVNGGFNFILWDSTIDTYYTMGEPVTGAIHTSGAGSQAYYVYNDGKVFMQLPSTSVLADPSHTSGNALYWYDYNTKTAVLKESISDQNDNCNYTGISHNGLFCLALKSVAGGQELYLVNLTTGVTTFVDSILSSAGFLYQGTPSNDGLYVIYGGEFFKPITNTYTLRIKSMENNQILPLVPNGTRINDTNHNVAPYWYNHNASIKSDNSCIYFQAHPINTAESVYSDTAVHFYRICSPVVTLSAPAESLTATYTVTINPSQEINDLTLSDLICTNCTLSNLQGSGIGPYTVTVTANTTGVSSVNLPKSSVYSGWFQTSDSNTTSTNYQPPAAVVLIPVVNTVSTAPVETKPIIVPTETKPIITPIEEIKPTSETTLSCPVFTKYLKLGNKLNDSEEVKKWQTFLNKYENEKLPITGFYGNLTFNAIKRFQSKYTDNVLKPWGLSKPTGYTYQSTRWMGNDIIGCPEGDKEIDNGNLLKK
jgi:hypothetical protein